TDAIIAVDKEGKIKTINLATEEMFGYPKQELVGLNVVQLLPKELHALHKTMLSKYKRPEFNAQKTQIFEIEGRKKNGGLFPISLSFTPIDNYREIRFVGVIHDDTKIKSQQNFLDAVIENIPNMVFVKEAESLRFTLFNKAGEELLGIPREQMIGKNDYDFFPKDQADFFVQKDREVLNRPDAIDIAKEPLETANKGQRMLHTRKIGIRDKNGKPQYLLGISEDITERIAMQERILKQAREDSLTGLANRTALFDFLNQEIKRAKRTDSKLAVLYLDLNNFKPINDSFGHSFGDRVLRQVARRLSNIARESDCVARIGGDEFIIVLSNIIDTKK
ncbi:MAG: diguanylate cyclase, partial [Kangiellaceae bacterium]|nr:diguanylate cyclase [Kangiellaceae bacterium]